MIIRPDKVLQNFEGKDWIYTYSKSYDSYFYRCNNVGEYELTLQGYDRVGEYRRDTFSYDKKEFYTKFIEKPNSENTKLIRLKSIICSLKDLINVSEIYNLLVEMEL
jgi:hypothetical protein